MCAIEGDLFSVFAMIDRLLMVLKAYTTLPFAAFERLHGEIKTQKHLLTWEGTPIPSESGCSEDFSRDSSTSKDGSSSGSSDGEDGSSGDSGDSDGSSSSNSDGGALKRKVRLSPYASSHADVYCSESLPVRIVFTQISSGGYQVLRSTTFANFCVAVAVLYCRRCSPRTV